MSRLIWQTIVALVARIHDVVHILTCSVVAIDLSLLHIYTSAPIVLPP